MGPQDFPKKRVLIWQFVEIFHFFSPKQDQKNCHFQTLLVLLKHDFLKIQGMAPCLSFSCRAADCRTHGICPVAQVMRPGNPSEGLESFGVLRQRSRSSTCMPFWSKEEPSRSGKLMMIFWARNLLLDWDAPFLRCQPGLLWVFMAASSQFSHTLSHQAIVPEAIPWHQDLPYWKARLLWLKIALLLVSCGVN